MIGTPGQLFQRANRVQLAVKARALQLNQGRSLLWWLLRTKRRRAEQKRPHVAGQELDLEDEESVFSAVRADSEFEM